MGPFLRIFCDKNHLRCIEFGTPFKWVYHPNLQEKTLPIRQGSEKNQRFQNGQQNLQYILGTILKTFLNIKKY